jgi:replicative DNA helicase
VNRFLDTIVAWLRAGYPEGVPPTDYVPLLALLSRRLTTDEVKAVAGELTRRGEFDRVDIGVLITQITDALPSPDDIARVQERLAAKGWPLDEHRNSGGRR